MVIVSMCRGYGWAFPVLYREAQLVVGNRRVQVAVALQHPLLLPAAGRARLHRGRAALPTGLRGDAQPARVLDRPLLYVAHIAVRYKSI